VIQHGQGLTALIFVAELILRIGLALRVVMRRLDIGATLSWLTVILSAPFVGAGLYLLVGESRLGRRRAQREAEIELEYGRYLDIHSQRGRAQDLALQHPIQRMARHAESIGGFPALGGNAFELFSDASAVLSSIVGEIDAAQRTVHMVFYIWGEGGQADDVAEALVRAAKRGLRCRLAVDAVGSQRFLRSARARQMREAGIEIATVLPVGLLRMLFVRADLRNHRKIVVIDGWIGYTGSMNLVDPRYFKQGSGRFGEWVDAMLRIEGPVVEQLNLLFLHDWEMETGFGLNMDDLPAFFEATGLVCPLDRGPAVAQLIASGPGLRRGVVHELLTSMVYAARDEVILTTPYFVPDPTLQAALVAAGHRGVRVRLIVPRVVDSRMVDLASRAYFDDLLAAGVEIHRFEGGLLHTKSVTVDGHDALFGTLNLDPRSFWLNFELMLLVHDDDVAHEIRRLQISYLDHCQPIEPTSWYQRPFHIRLTENVVQLFTPLL
jgi:cardiolipin synthase